MTIDFERALQVTDQGEEYGYWDVAVRILSLEMVVAVPGHNFRICCSGSAGEVIFDDDLDAGEQAACAQCIADHKAAAMGG